jgi:integrase
MRKPCAYIRAVDATGTSLRAYVKFQAPDGRMLARAVPGEAVPPGKRQQTDLKKRIAATIGHELTQASIRAATGCATADDRFLLAAYDVPIATGATPTRPAEDITPVAQSVRDYLRHVAASMAESTYKYRSNTTERWRSWCTAQGIEDIGIALSQENLLRYREWRKEHIKANRKKNRSTDGARALNEDRDMLVSLEKFALQTDTVAEHLPNVREKTRVRSLPDPESLGRLIRTNRGYPIRPTTEPDPDEIQQRWDLIFRLLVETGIRGGELVHLEWGDLDLGKKPLLKIRAKEDWSPRFKKERDVPMREELARDILAWRDSLPETRTHRRARVLTQPDGRGYVYLPKTLFKRLFENAGLPYHGLHILRHRACVQLFRANFEPATIQKIMGHSNVKTTVGIYMRYTSTENIDRTTLPAAP